jgi:predicted double-glycine peptidase
MRVPITIALGAVLVLGALAKTSYSAPPTITTWSVSGIENAEGAYVGTAQLALDRIECTFSLAARTATGKTIAWSGKGRLEWGAVTLTLDAGFTIPGAGTSYSAGTAQYVVNDDGTLSGHWSLTSATKTKAGPGATETLVLASGSPLVPSVTGAAPPRMPASALAVPLVTQPDQYSCGDASLQAVLYYYRASDGDLHALYKPLGTTAANGTMQGPIVAYALTVGLEARYVTGATLQDLQASLAARDPVMLVIQAWKSTTTPWAQDTNDGHWVVLVGLDATYAYFMDPWAHFGYGYMPISELMDRWHCWETTAVVQHEAIFFHGDAPPPSDGLVRMQ